VKVNGPLLCIPRRVTVIETPERVQLAVYYGLPTPSDGAVPNNVTGCPLEDDVTGSVLVPIALSDPIGKRTVESFDGAPLTLVDRDD
jgi:hypothetical protein